MKKVILLIVLSISISCHAQENTLSQFENITTKIDKLLQELRYDSIPEELKKIADYANDINSDSIQTLSNQYHAKYYYYINDYERATYFMIEAAKGFERMRDSLGASKMYHNLSQLLAAAGDDTKNMQYKKKALQLCPESLNKEWHISVLLGIANTFRGRGKHDSSYNYLNQALDKSKILNYSDGIGMAYYQLSLHYQSLKEYKKAIQYFDIVQKKYNNNIPRATLENSFFYESQSQLAIGDYEHALQNIKQCIALSEQSGMTLNAAANYDLLAQIYEKKGLYKQAYTTYRKSSNFKDSILNVKKQTAIIELEKKYETEKKEKENLVLKQENTRKDLTIANKNNLLLLLALLAILIAALITIYWISKINNEKIKRTKTEQKLRRLQINPHFFFNALNSIQNNLLSSEDKKSTVKFITKFSKLMRQTLESSFHDFSDIEDEIEMLENYMELQILRFKENFSYNIVNNCPDQIKIPTQIIQPFIENAIEHGFKELSHQGHIDIQFEIKNKDSLKIQIKDNGHGITVKKHPERVSRSQDIIRERLLLFKKPKEYYFEYVPSPEGTLVNIYCPFE